MIRGGVLFQARGILPVPEELKVGLAAAKAAALRINLSNEVYIYVGCPLAGLLYGGSACKLIRRCLATPMPRTEGECGFMKLMKSNKGWRSLECLFTS
jgi:hypothetical protein